MYRSEDEKYNQNRMQSPHRNTVLAENSPMNFPQSTPIPPGQMRSIIQKKYSISDSRLCSSAEPHFLKTTRLVQGDLSESQPNIQLESQSPGLTSRVIQYNNEHRRSAFQYDGPGVFPIVHIHKENSLLTKKRPRKVISSLSSTELSRYTSPERDRFYLDYVSGNDSGKRRALESNSNVLEALKEISRKRIHSSEDALLVESNGKRSRVEIGGVSSKIKSTETNFEASTNKKSVASSLASDRKVYDELMASRSSMIAADTTGKKVAKPLEKVDSKISLVPKPRVRSAAVVASSRSPRPSTKSVSVETQTIPPANGNVGNNFDGDLTQWTDAQINAVDSAYVPPMKIINDKPLELLRKKRLALLVGGLSGLTTKEETPKGNDENKVEAVEVGLSKDVPLTLGNKKPTSKKVTFDLGYSADKPKTTDSINYSDVSSVGVDCATTAKTVTQTSEAMTTPIVSSSTRQPSRLLLPAIVGDPKPTEIAKSTVVVGESVSGESSQSQKNHSLVPNPVATSPPKASTTATVKPTFTAPLFSFSSSMPNTTTITPTKNSFQMQGSSVGTPPTSTFNITASKPVVTSAAPVFSSANELAFKPSTQPNVFTSIPSIAVTTTTIGFELKSTVANINSVASTNTMASSSTGSTAVTLSSLSSNKFSPQSKPFAPIVSFGLDNSKNTNPKNTLDFSFNMVAPTTAAVSSTVSSNTTSTSSNMNTQAPLFPTSITSMKLGEFNLNPGIPKENLFASNAATPKSSTAASGDASSVIISSSNNMMVGSQSGLVGENPQESKLNTTSNSFNFIQNSAGLQNNVFNFNANKSTPSSSGFSFASNPINNTVTTNIFTNTPANDNKFGVQTKAPDNSVGLASGTQFPANFNKPAAIFDVGSTSNVQTPQKTAESNQLFPTIGGFGINATTNNKSPFGMPNTTTTKESNQATFQFGKDAGNKTMFDGPFSGQQKPQFGTVNRTSGTNFGMGSSVFGETRSSEMPKNVFGSSVEGATATFGGNGSNVFGTANPQATFSTFQSQPNFGSTSLNVDGKSNSGSAPTFGTSSTTSGSLGVAKSPIFNFGSGNNATSTSNVFSFGSSEPPKSTFNFSGTPTFGAPPNQLAGGGANMFNIGSNANTAPRSRMMPKGRRRT